MTDTTYNGWANHATWNVALWIGGDEGLYTLAKDCNDYPMFRDTMEELYGDAPHSNPIAYRTPDGVAWNDSGLNEGELNEMIQEIV